MNEAFKKLSNQIQFIPTKTFENVSITKVTLDKAKDAFFIEFDSIDTIPFSEMIIFLSALNKNFKHKSDFQFKIVDLKFDLNEILLYLSWILRDFLKKPQLQTSFMNSKYELNGSNFTITLGSQTHVESAKRQQETIERVMHKLGFQHFTITCLSETTNILQEAKSLARKEASEAITVKSVEPKGVTTKFKKRGYHHCPISELEESGLSQVIVQGEVFSIDEKETKGEYIITQIAITDYESAIYLKMFAKKTDTKKLAVTRNLDVGNHVIVQGQYQVDTYTKENVIMANSITVLNNEGDDDTDAADIKRVEFNIKTKMSTMDGIASAKDVVKKAKQWGHTAIAISDIDSIQSFPDFYNATKDDKDIKAIFGATLSVIEDSNRSMVNPTDLSLKDETYIVFDLETTDLSPIFGHIIEFGGVKMKDGKVIDKNQMFMNPGVPISAFTTELTSITNADVADAKTEKEALQDVLDYIGNHTLVAHNANFDLSFLNEKLVEHGYEKLTNTVIDTLAVARILNPNFQSYKLGTVAKRLSVSYDSSIAHRADYDAIVLSSVWRKMIVMLEEEMEITTQKQLDEYRNDDLKKKLFSNYVNVIVKNQKGLKELFQLITKSSTEDYHRGNKLQLGDVLETKDLLIGAGGLNSRLHDKMFFGTKQQIIDEISKYDYIEVQPPENYAHLINRGLSIENLHAIIRFVVQEALSQNKIVIASSDARYVNKKDKIYHEIYINAKGLGGVRHKLFRFKEDDPVYPSLHVRKTDEMLESFAFLEDVKLINQIVIGNTNMMADMIEDVQVIKDRLYTPTFGDSDSDLEKLAYKTARDLYGEVLPEIVEARLKRELEPIIKYGFAVIYWISHLLVKKSLDDGYLVGSRGSVGSSFVATMTNITEVNPLCPHYICSKCKHSEFLETSELNSGYDLPDKKCPKCDIDLMKEGQNIPFETFLGFEADKVPDIDLNFSGVYQPTIHHEVKVLFGDKHAFRAGTISTVAEKTAFGYVKGWAEATGKTLPKPFIEYLAKGVAGTKRTTGQHPGGIIVIPGEYDVEDFSAVNFPANDVNAAWKTTHFDFHAIHDNVLKLDLLGHDDPTAIKQLEKITGLNVKRDIPFFDPKVISLFSSPKALGIEPKDILNESTGAMGIPEFGTKFVRGMLKKAKVESFGDLIAISGLSHGTNVWTNNAEIVVKKLNIPISDTISCRDNIMTDLIAKNVEPKTSFTIMEKVRKGKGITEDEIKMLREHDVEDWYIDSLQKIEYMFPKAHATAYVMMAWRIAWFKVYHPLAYYATYFTTRADSVDVQVMKSGKKAIEVTLKDYMSRRFKRGEEALTNKEQGLIPVLEIANELYARGYTISNIDVHTSLASEWIVDEPNKTIIPPMSALDGLGEAAAQSVVDARQSGEFVSKKDLNDRTQINKTSIKKLEELGVLDGMDATNQIEFNLFG